MLHDAFLAGGAFVQVPAGVVVEDPILVLHWCEGDGRASFPHTIVSLGEHAEATVLDRFGSPETDHLVDAVTELLVADNAHLRYLSIQQHGTRTWHLGLQRALVGRDATLRSVGGRARRRLRAAAQRDACSQGEGGESDQLAVYFADGSQMLDFRTLQDHDAPRTRSDLLFKGAVEDVARSVYSGLVHLRPTAQKANAFQTNRNLVLTEGASAESIPNLEIEANDVKCSHASTVGPIDDDQLYYLESRGIPPEDAERLIVLGFFDDVLERLPVSALSRRAAPLRRRQARAPAGGRGQIAVGDAVRVCARDDLAPGIARAASTSTGTASRVVRIGDDFYAIGDTCSHADFSLSEGDVWADELEIECPKHGSTFSLTTGEPQTLPATQPVPVYEVVRRRRRREGRGRREHPVDRGTARQRRRQRDPARRRPRGSLRRGARADGPERFGQVDAVARARWGAATTR